jgi:hypothetical protein
LTIALRCAIIKVSNKEKIMKRIFVVISVMALVGCVVVPRTGPVLPYDVPGRRQPVMVYEEHVLYPFAEHDYYYDRFYGAHFFVGQDRKRHWMPRGWSYDEHGIPGHPRH